MYCGEMTSRNSQPAGTPAWLMRTSRSRAMRSPSLMRKLPFMYGSLISPFQPTVVRGFSKYTRISTSSSPSCRSLSACNFLAYSSAASGSWIEHGPMTTSSWSERPRRMSRTLRRVFAISDSTGVPWIGKKRIRCSGGGSGTMFSMRSSSVREVLSSMGCVMVSSARG